MEAVADQTLTASDLMAGTLACIAQRGRQRILLPGSEFDVVMEQVCRDLLAEGLALSFRVCCHPFWGHSETARAALLGAVQTALIVPQPGYADLRLDAHEASLLQQHLPDSPAYERFALALDDAELLR